MSIVGSIFSILDWVKDKLPIQDRKERWRNELDKLQKEKETLLKGKPDAKKANRLSVIELRIAELLQLFKNQTSK